MKLVESPSRSDAHEEIAALIETLRATEQRLEQLTAGEVDTVADRDGRTFLLRRAQEQLRDTEAARQAAILNALPAHIALLNPQGIILSVNEVWQRFARTNGMDVAKAGPGINYLEVCDRARGNFSSEAHRVAEGIRSVLAGSLKSFSIEYPCHSPTEQRWFLLTVTPLADDRRNGAVVMHSNITERRRAENALEELSQQTERRERVLNTTLSCISDFAYIFDREGRFLFANQPLCKLLGITSEAIVGKNFLGLGYPEALAGHLQQQIQEVFATATSITDETPFTNPAGLDGYYEYIFSPVIAADGNVEFVVGSTRDVTERKLSQAMLQESEGRYRALVDWSPDSLAVSREGRILFVNPAAVRMMGATFDDQLIGKSVLDHVHPDSRATARERLMVNAASGGVLPMIEEKFIRLDGTVIDVEIQGRSFNYNGAPATFSSIRDITDRKRSAEALRSSEHEQRQLAEQLGIERSRLVAAQRVGKVGSWETDLASMATIWSEETHRIFETDPATFHPTHEIFLEFIHPDDRVCVNEAFLHSLDQRAPSVAEHRVLLPDGRIRFVEEHWQVLFDSEDKPVRAIGTCQDITERKLAEKAILEREAEFHTLAEAMPQIVWITRPDGANIYFNQQWMDYTGLTLEESAGDGWNRPFHPDDQQRAADAWHTATATLGTYSLESRLRRADGVYRWWLVRGVPMQDADGNVLKWFGTCTDIHDMKMAELEVSRTNLDLLESKRRFTDMLGNIDMVSMMLDTNGSITYCNDYLLRLTGWRREEVMGRNWFEVFIPPDLPLNEAFSTLLEDQPSAAHHENEILTRSGDRRLIRWNNTTLHSATGEVIGTASIGDDVTERTQAQARSRLQSEALDASANAVVITDRDLAIVWINAAFTELTAYTFDEAIGRNVQDLLRSGVHDPSFYKEIRDTIAGGESWSGVMTNRTRDGRLYPEAQTITPVKDSEGAVSHFISIKTDLTAQHLMEAQLRQAQKMEAVGQLAAGVAHEFNNLLQALMSMAAIVRLRTDKTQVAKIGGDMEVQIRRGANLTQQLLQFSRRQAIEKTGLDLGAEVQKASVLLRPLIPENLRIVVETSPQRLSVEADAGQMQQVLLNFAINARDAMPDGGTLTLRAGSCDGEVFFEVEDTGHGVDEATRSRMFEPFFTTKEVGKGTGLGLAVVHGIVAQHSGRIEVHSRLGEGTRIRVILPAATYREDAAVTNIDDCEVTPGTGRVLLVEDEPGVRQGIAALLEAIGYEVIAVDSGEEAIKLPLELNPDVLLSDVTLSGMAGSALAERLRERWPSMKVVLMSGYSEPELRADVRDRGWLFLQKPFEMSDLARHLGESR